MEVSALPWTVLVAAVGGLTVLLGVRGAGSRSGAPAAPGAAGPGEDGAPPPAAPPPFPDDDLPAFGATPPGTPGAPGAAARPARRPGIPAPAAPAPAAATGRAVSGMAAAALALIALLAVVAITAPGERPPAARPGSPSAGSSAAAPEPPRTTMPALPPVPADPLPGEPGAGTLAMRSVPLGRDGLAARLTFGGIVLERRAVGSTVAFPAVSVTSSGDGTAALAHVRLPTWNCLATEPPEDPVAAGCRPGLTEYADLPSPALSATREGDGLRLTGRFPTYTRPTGSEPVYTGRVYELTVTLAPAGPEVAGWAPATGTLFLGTDRVASLDRPGLNAVRRAG